MVGAAGSACAIVHSGKGGDTMRTEDYDYELPTELIAQTPLERRSGSRLLVLDRACRGIRHTQFETLPTLLSPGDLMIANDSRVMPARLRGVKVDTGAAVEILLLRPHTTGAWEVLARPSKRLKSGQVISFGGGLLQATVQDGGDDGTRLVRFSAQADQLETLFAKFGEMPLPPYIRSSLADPERYQTVYAREVGSAAAPTAGLHFTPEVLQAVRARGVDIEFLTLHVGLGTFRPVQVDRIEEHHMHAEWFDVPVELLERIRETRARGGRVLSVGTTTVRALESAARRVDAVEGVREARVSGWTDIFLYPGVELLATDALLTNFHLPKSTLLMLVSALAGRDLILSAYRAAVAEQYRFFSFGDAMLIW